MLGFLKKKSHKTITVGIAIPYTQEQFEECYNQRTDFIHSLTTLYQTNNLEALWEQYAPTAKRVSETLSSIRSYGGKVISCLSSSDFNTIQQSDVVIIVAHGYDNGSVIEMFDGPHNPSEIAHLFAPSYKGIVDLSSCYSSALISILKTRCPGCKVIGVSSKTSLSLRLVICLQALRIMRSSPEMEYADAMGKALEFLHFHISKSVSDSLYLNEEYASFSPVEEERFLSVHECLPSSASPANNTVYLGGEEYSSVYAPGSVKKGSTFLVQVFLHDESEQNEVSRSAKFMDDESELRKSKVLDISPKSGDYVEVDLCSVGDVDGFIIDEQRQSFRWRNEFTSVEFPVVVSPDCESPTFVGKIRVFINKVPASLSIVKIKVVSDENIDVGRADISYQGYDKSAEQDAQRISLLNTLNESIRGLECASSSSADTKEQGQIDLCKHCIEIINNNADICNPVKRVFISSTSDMPGLREVTKQQVESCNMYPEMYENWHQGSNHPCDECCKKVLSSDVFLCILGPKYGSVIPAFGMSMTEIEYRVALQSGKPILVYIMKDYLKKMADSEPEEREFIERQKAFIKEVKETRMVDFFEDELDLSLMARTELMMVKKDIEHDRAS